MTKYYSAPQSAPLRVIPCPIELPTPVNGTDDWLSFEFRSWLEDFGAFLNMHTTIKTPQGRGRKSLRGLVIGVVALTGFEPVFSP